VGQTRTDTEDLEAAIMHLENEVRKRFTGNRLLKHTFSVAETCRDTARRMERADVTPEAAYLAALAHDLFKDRPQDELRELILNESIPIDQHSWRIGAGLLHAPVATHYIKTRLGISKTDILSAVYFHTTGRAGACVLERILFCADYMDPSRPQRKDEPDIDDLRRRMAIDLTEIYCEIVGRKISYTQYKRRPLHPNGIAAWNELCVK
jgi:predicted HD superfamily hydrolase involved in NAD metabolism